MRRFHSRLPLRFILSIVAVVAVGAATSRADTPPVYHVGFHTISSGGDTLHNACFHLSGTLGQVAPGYSTGDAYALISGFWQFLPSPNPDEIFYNSFEEC
jgi:hypothetical protein